MKKKLLSVILTTMLVFSFSACGSTEEKTEADTKQEVQETEEKKEEAQKEDAESEEGPEEDLKDATYQSILDEYTQKITDATLDIIDEYNEEAKDKKGDVTALAEISSAKTEKIAEICVDGTEKIKKLMIKNGDKSSVYEEWGNKLYEVFLEQAQQITETYMSSSTGQ